MAIQFLEQLLRSFTRWVFSLVWLTLLRKLKISPRFLRVRHNFHVYAWPFIHCLYFIYARKFYMRLQGKITQQWKSTPWEACSVTAFLKAVILWFLLMFLSSLQQLFSYSLSLSLALMLLLIQFQGRLPTGLDWTGLIIIILIIPLFTLGSIYSTSASGAEQMPETNNSNWTQQG